MARIQFGSNKGPQEPLPPRGQDSTDQKNFSLPEHPAKELTDSKQVAEKRAELERHAMPGPLKELMQERSPLEQQLVSMGIVLGSVEAITQIPIAFKKALDKHLKNG